MPKFDEKHWKPSSLANVWDFVCLPCYRQTFLKQDGYSAFEPSLYCNLKGNVCCFSPNGAYKKTWRMQKNSFCLAHGVFYRWLLCRENRHIHQGHSDDEAHAAHLHVVNIAVPKQEKKTLKTCNGTYCVRDRKIPDVLKSSICDVFGAQMANSVKKKQKNTQLRVCDITVEYSLLHDWSQRLWMVTVRMCSPGGKKRRRW